MTEARRDNLKPKPKADTPAGARRAWHKPTLTSYGPIGRLTQGGSGVKSDGSSGKKAASCL